MPSAVASAGDLIYYIIICGYVRVMKRYAFKMWCFVRFSQSCSNIFCSS